MIKTGYDARLSAGAIAAGGTLGILIPPSVMLVVMGPTMGVPVNLLYSAAFGPGFLLAGCYIAYTLGRSFINPKLGPPMTMEERKAAYDAMTTEKVGARRGRIGSRLPGRDDLSARGLAVEPGGRAASSRSAPARSTFRASPSVPALLTAFPYFRNAYFRAVVLGIAPLSALIGFTLGHHPRRPGDADRGGLLRRLRRRRCWRSLYGRLSSKSATNAAVGTMVTSAMVLFLAVASNVFGAVFTKLGTASLITSSCSPFRCATGGSWR